MGSNSIWTECQTSTSFILYDYQMLTSFIQPIVLCGGSGTRLWPLSRKSYPKQFVPVLNGKNLLQLTLDRLLPLSTTGIWAVGAEDHRFMITESMQTLDTDGTVLLEPMARNTSAAMAIAALWATQKQDNPLLLFCPADHHIPNAELFAQSIVSGLPSALAGRVVTFGVVPSFPSTAYGYILYSEPVNQSAYRVSQFIEKPNTETAQQLLLQGQCLWNAGIFLVQASVLLDALQTHAADILQSCRLAMQDAQTERSPSGHTFVRPNKLAFETCRSQSIDYAVMEAHPDLAVVPFAGQWSDVGSWNAVADLKPKGPDGNRIDGQGFVIRSHNTYVHAPTRPVVTLGVQDLFVIDTPDAVLVAHRDCAEAVKEVVAQLEAQGIEQAVTHRRVARPWGWYDSIDRGDGFQVKRIGVKPGASLSLQKHHHRAEHWIVVKGTAEVTNGDQVLILRENQSTYIPLGVVHRLRNPGQVELEIIEVQSGNYLGEDDIVRFEDTYGRVKS
jgi:mannose-1-phosphate guanylyltransferase / mannose-6-phosphate isomerase